MKSDRQKSLFRQHVHIWSTGDFTDFTAVIAPNYRGHVSTGDRDRAGLEARIRAFREIYTDITFTIEDQLTEGDKVVTRLTAHGTQRTTGEPTILIGINISRTADDQIVEEWATWEPFTPG